MHDKTVPIPLGNGTVFFVFTNKKHKMTCKR